MNKQERVTSLETYCNAHRCADCPVNAIPVLDPDGPCILTLALCGIDFEADV